MSDRPFDQNLGDDPAMPMAEGNVPQPSAPPPVTTTPAPPPVPMEPGTAGLDGDESREDHEDHESSTTETAKEQAAAVGQEAKQSAGQVAQTATEEVRNVAGEAKSQAQSLLSQVRDDVSIQAHDQQQRAAQGLHGLAGEFDQMAQNSDSSMASGLVSQAAQRLGGVAGWLEDREPSDLLDDVKRYARRNPGTFLAICGLVGLVGGRLTRSLRDDAAEDQGGSQGGGGYSAAGGRGPGSTTYQYAPDAGVYATSTGVPTAYATRDYPSDLDAVDELPVGDELIAREDGDRL